MDTATLFLLARRVGDDLEQLAQRPEWRQSVALLEKSGKMKDGVLQALQGHARNLGDGVGAIELVLLSQMQIIQSPVGEALAREIEDRANKPVASRQTRAKLLSELQGGLANDSGRLKTLASALQASGLGVREDEATGPEFGVLIPLVGSSWQLDDLQRFLRDCDLNLRFALEIAGKPESPTVRRLGASWLTFFLSLDPTHVQTLVEIVLFVYLLRKNRHQDELIAAQLRAARREESAQAVLDESAQRESAERAEISNRLLKERGGRSNELAIGLQKLIDFLDEHIGQGAVFEVRGSGWRISAERDKKQASALEACGEGVARQIEQAKGLAIEAWAVAARERLPAFGGADPSDRSGEGSEANRLDGLNEDESK